MGLVRPLNISDRRCSAPAFIPVFAEQRPLNPQVPPTSFKLELREGALPNAVRRGPGTSVGTQIMSVRTDAGAAELNYNPNTMGNLNNLNVW